jgi:glycerate kinase
VRVLVAPASFAGTLSAAGAAAAIAEGWGRVAPGDETTVLPLPDVEPSHPTPPGLEPAGPDIPDLPGLQTAFDGRPGLVLTGEGCFDWRSLRGSVIAAVARKAAEQGVPCLVLAGQVLVGRREAGAIGVDTSYSVAEHAGGLQASLADPQGTLAALAAHVAAQWSR